MAGKMQLVPGLIMDLITSDIYRHTWDFNGAYMHNMACIRVTMANTLMFILCPLCVTHRHANHGSYVKMSQSGIDENTATYTEASSVCNAANRATAHTRVVFFARPTEGSDLMTTCQIQSLNKLAGDEHRGECSLNTGHACVT